MSVKIDYSQLQTYISCPKLYCNKYINKIRKRKLDEGQQSRSFGSDIHKVLELWQTTDLRAGIDWFKQNYECLPDEKIRTMANGIQLATDYVKWEGLNLPGIKTLGTEIKDSFMIGDTEYIVKIDRVVEFNGNIFVLDYKTTTSKTHMFFKQFNPNMQVSGYCNYVKKKWGSCSGFLPMAIQMGFRSRMYKGEPAGFWSKFDYEIINRTKEQLDEFEVNVKDWVGKLSADSTYPKNEGNCNSFYGCGYRDLCVSGDDESIQEQLYEDYNPTEYLEGVKE